MHFATGKQLRRWRSATTCTPTRSTPTAPVVDVKELHAKIGQFTLENDF
jgi:hypothetical protein